MYSVIKFLYEMEWGYMEAYKVLEIKQSIFENNDRQAELLREDLKKEGVFLLNLMSSPGSGKTTTVLRTIDALKNEINIGVMEADIDSEVDANKVSKSGVKVIQLHTGGKKSLYMNNKK